MDHRDEHLRQEAERQRAQERGSADARSHHPAQWRRTLQFVGRAEETEAITPSIQAA